MLQPHDNQRPGNIYSLMRKQEGHHSYTSAIIPGTRCHVIHHMMYHMIQLGHNCVPVLVEAHLFLTRAFVVKVTDTWFIVQYRRHSCKLELDWRFLENTQFSHDGDDFKDSRRSWMNEYDRQTDRQTYAIFHPLLLVEGLFYNPNSAEHHITSLCQIWAKYIGMFLHWTKLR